VEYKPWTDANLPFSYTTYACEHDLTIWVIVKCLKSLHSLRKSRLTVDTREGQAASLESYLYEVKHPRPIAENNAMRC
jgi:hypothetical protein